MHNKILDYTEQNGLVFCQSIDKAMNNAEILYISEVKKLKASAVFFRRFYKDNEKKPYHSEPAVCIFKEEDITFNSKKHIELHAALWSAGKNEIYIIQGQTRTDIINARKPTKADKNKKLSISEDLILASDAVKAFDEQQFSSYLFGTGTFWEQTEFENQLNEKNSPYVYLLDYLMKVRKEFLNPLNFKLAPSTTDKLLVICILVKFLEEIKDDESGKHTLHDIYKKYSIHSFVEAIEKKYLLEVLIELGNEFNGKIFDKFSDTEKDKIKETDLTLLAQFLKADIDINTKQIFIWEQYSFKHLPAEIISSIYENFIQEEAKRENDGKTEKGVVYTPIHLVNFLIDEVMPLNRADLFINESFKIFDGSCGSGVFLVAAYKRLLQWWAINHSFEGNINYPDSKVAQKILEDNIFGVDVKETAVLVSIFGLTTALLDKLTPKEIWNNLKFKDLSQRNIQRNNFFKWAVEAKSNGEIFDLAIGNPPFNVETGFKKEDVLDPDLLKQLNIKHKEIPNNNFALHFFEGSMTLAKKVCLIIPSNVLLYNRAETANKYRTELFTDFTVSKIFDFTHLRESLFTKKNQAGVENQKKTGRTPVVALIAENVPSENQSIEHTVIKRMTSTEKNIRFEIDDYDSHKVRWSWAIDENKQFVWKTNLLGGGRLFHLIYRLSLLPTLQNFINEKKKENSDWIYSSGYKIGGKSVKKNPAVYLHLKNTIDTRKKFNLLTHEFSTIIETESEFEAPRGEKLYSDPVLIISEVLGKEKIPMQLFAQYQPFNISFIGIHAPNSELETLKRIYQNIYVNNNNATLYRTYMLLTSPKLLINKETAFIKEDLDCLPYPENEEYLTLSSTEKILQDDVLNYYIRLGKAISKNSDGAILHKNVGKLELQEYGEVFCNTLNEIYAKNNKSWQLGKVYQTSLYSICQFGFGKNDGLKFQYFDSLDDEIKLLMENQASNSRAIYTRIIRMYKHINGYDCVYFIKPNALRYWLKSIALRDADDTFVTLKSAGF